MFSSHLDILAQQEGKPVAVNYLAPAVQAMITIRQADTQTCLIDIHGKITALSENMLIDAYTRASAAGAQTIILNFARLEYMSSYGLNQLIAILGRIRRQQQRLLVFGLSPHYRKILRITGLDQFMSLYDCEAEALAAARAY
jgi:anti-anti-sigma factor